MSPHHVLAVLATLALFTYAESAGIPLPGTTALLAAGVLAGDGRVSVIAVCAVAIVACIAGGATGYAVGHRFGTWILTRPGRLERHRRRVYETGSRFVVRYGWSAALVCRFFSILREGVPVLCGALRMPWRGYIGWNSVGAVAWVLWHVLLGFFVGAAAGITRGLTAIAVFKIALAVAVGAAVAVRRLRRRAVRAD